MTAIREEDKRGARRAWRIQLVVLGIIFLQFASLPVWLWLLIGQVELARRAAHAYFREGLFVSTFPVGAAMVLFNVLVLYRPLPRVRAYVITAIWASLALTVVWLALIFPVMPSGAMDRVSKLAGNALVASLVAPLMVIVVPALWVVWWREGPPWVAFQRSRALGQRLKRWKRWKKQHAVGRTRCTVA